MLGIGLKVKNKSETPREKSKFSFCKWLAIGESFWIRDGNMCLLLFALGGAHPWRPCACCLVSVSSLWVHMCTYHVEDLVSWCYPYPLACMHFIPPFQQVSLTSEGRDLIETSNLGLLSFSTYHLVVGLFIPICYKSKHLWWWLRKEVIYKYENMSLGVILCQCTFSRTVIFGFTLGPWFGGGIYFQ